MVCWLQWEECHLGGQEFGRMSSSCQSCQKSSHSWHQQGLFQYEVVMFDHVQYYCWVCGSHLPSKVRLLGLLWVLGRCWMSMGWRRDVCGLLPGVSPGGFSRSFLVSEGRSMTRPWWRWRDPGVWYDGICLWGAGWHRVFPWSSWQILFNISHLTPVVEIWTKLPEPVVLLYTLPPVFPLVGSHASFW